jgi:hypothetical protein
MVKPSKPKKKKSVSQLKKEADAVFSRYIRYSAADHAGNARCVTCGVVKHWKELQNGHYERRSVNSLRYDERNCHPQCPGCNIFKGGNYPRYAQFMLQTYGPTILEELEAEAKNLKQFRPFELIEIIDLYKAKLLI